MKKSILFSFTIVMMITFSFAGNAPEIVTSAFNKKFPNATILKWDKENANNYEAAFVWKGVNHSANFSDKGEWLETESLTTFDKMPEKVQQAFNTAHKGAKIKAVAKIENAKNETLYEIEVKKGLKAVEYFYNADGTIHKEYVNNPETQMRFGVYF